MNDAATSAEQGDEYDVVASYASADSATVLPIVDRLGEIGYRIWVDRRRIQGFYAGEITLAIEKSKAVLFFASEESFRSENTLTELSLANRKKKAIVPVYLEPATPPANFEYFLARPQSVDLTAFPRERWADEIRKKLHAWGVDASPTASPVIAEQAQRVLGSVRSRDMNAHPLKAYLADRRTQEHEVYDAFIEHVQDYPRRPLVLIAVGRQEQAVNEYVDRLQTHTLPRTLTRMQASGYQQVIHRINRPWAEGDWAAAPRRTLGRLQRDLLQHFELGLRDWPDQFVATLGKLEAVPMICYHLYWQNWTEDHLRTLRAWILEWAQLPDLPRGCPIVVVVAVQDLTPERRAHFPWLRPPKAAAAELRKLVMPKRRDLSVVALSELTNVHVDDVEEWIRESVDGDASAMIARFYEVLDDPKLFAADGVPMSGFARWANSFLSDAGRRQGRMG